MHRRSESGERRSPSSPHGTAGYTEFRASPGALYPSDDYSIPDSRYYDQQNCQPESVQFERVEQTIEGSPRSQGEQTPASVQPDQVLGDRKSTSSKSPSREVHSPLPLPTPSLSRQVSDDAFLDEILQDLSKPTRGSPNSNDHVDTEFLDDLDSSNFLDWWQGPAREQDKRRSSSNSPVESSVPAARANYNQLPGVPMRRQSTSDQCGAKVPQQAQHQRSSPPPSHSPSATQALSQAPEFSEQRYSNTTTSAAGSKRSSPLVGPVEIASVAHPPPPQNFHTTSTTITTLSEQNRTQHHSDDSTSTQPPTKVQLVQLVQSTCGQTYFVVPN